MLHSLALIKIENGGPKHFFKAFLQVTFINGNLAAEFFDRDRFTNMLDQDLSCLCYFITVSFICKKLTVDNINFFFTQHAIETVQKQHLGLCININIFKTISESMIQQSF